MTRNTVKYQPIPTAVDDDDGNERSVKDKLRKDDDDDDDAIDWTLVSQRRWARAGGTLVLMFYSLVNVGVVWMVSIDESRGFAPVAIFCSCMCVPLILMMYIMDPGIVIPSDSDFDPSATIENGVGNSDGVVEGSSTNKVQHNGRGYTWCDDCQCWQPDDEAIKHCFVCGICMRQWDRHCSSLANCVAQRSRRVFIVLVLCAAVGLAATSTMLVQMLRYYKFPADWVWWCVLFVCAQYWYFAVSFLVLGFVQLVIVNSGITAEAARSAHNLSDSLRQLSGCSNVWRFWCASWGKGRSRYEHVRRRQELGYLWFH